MSTITTKKLTGAPFSVGREARLVQVVIDFEEYNITATNIVQIFQCPEDYLVLEAGYEILTAGTASGTLDLGKAGGTELLSAIALDAAAGTKAAGSAANPVFFNDSDTIDIQINTSTMIAGKIRIWWVGIDVSELNTVANII
jgi:hypothetical protein